MIEEELKAEIILIASFYSLVFLIDNMIREEKNGDIFMYIKTILVFILFALRPNKKLTIIET